MVEHGVPMKEILATIEEADNVRKKRMQSLQSYFTGPQWDFVHVGLEKASKAFRFKKDKGKVKNSRSKNKKVIPSASPAATAAVACQ